MADLDPNPRSIDQAYDLGFCDAMNCTESVAAENIRLRAQLLDRCEQCTLHQLQPDLNAMTRQRDIWKWAALALGVLCLLWGAKG